MNLLVLVQNYPDESDSQRFAYVHTRNKYYLGIGVEVLVLAFDAEKEYIFENVTITNSKIFRKKYDINQFDAIISHAPNLHNHLRFLHLNARSKNIFFFIHGHEVLKQSEYYPEPFIFFKPRLANFKKMIVNLYDEFKLAGLRIYFNRNLVRGRIKLVFVSEWMKNEFQKNMKIGNDLVESNSIIIYNAAARELLDNHYNYPTSGKTRIITIRQFDNPKYAVDLVVKAAIDNPDIEFHLFGKGFFFNFIQPPNNLLITNKFFTHQELPDLFNKYTAAFMPSRLDSQGVMMCEMAAFGIPLITSDIPICREMLNNFTNVFYISNNSNKILLQDILKKIDSDQPVNKIKFSSENTILHEIKYFYQIIYNTEFRSKTNE